MVSIEEIWLHPRMLNKVERVQQSRGGPATDSHTIMCPRQEALEDKVDSRRETESMRDPTPTHLQSSAHRTQGQHHLEVSRR